LVTSGTAVAPFNEFVDADRAPVAGLDIAQAVAGDPIHAG